MQKSRFAYPPEIRHARMSNDQWKMPGCPRKNGRFSILLAIARNVHILDDAGLALYCKRTGCQQASPTQQPRDKS